MMENVPENYVFICHSYLHTGMFICYYYAPLICPPPPRRPFPTASSTLLVYDDVSLSFPPGRVSQPIATTISRVISPDKNHSSITSSSVVIFFWKCPFLPPFFPTTDPFPSSLSFYTVSFNFHNFFKARIIIQGDEYQRGWKNQGSYEYFCVFHPENSWMLLVVSPIWSRIWGVADCLKVIKG